MNIFFWHKRIHKYTCYRDSVGQRSIIDFCIVSVDLFSSVVDIRVKRGAEVSTNHHLTVCIRRDLNHPRTRKRFRAQREYRIKWELLSDKKVRHTFASKVASLFRKVPNFTEDVEIEWDLFKSAAASCGRKRVRGQMGRKRTAWWNQKIKEAIRAKKIVFKAWLTNKSSEQRQLRYSAARKTAITIVKQSKENSCEEFGQKLDTICRSTHKYFEKSSNKHQLPPSLRMLIMCF